MDRGEKAENGAASFPREAGKPLPGWATWLARKTGLQLRDSAGLGAYSSPASPE